MLFSQNVVISNVRPSIYDLYPNTIEGPMIKNYLAAAHYNSISFVKLTLLPESLATLRGKKVVNVRIIFSVVLVPSLTYKRDLGME